jgi:hypothetical protein
VKVSVVGVVAGPRKSFACAASGSTWVEKPDPTFVRPHSSSPHRPAVTPAYRRQSDSSARADADSPGTGDAKAAGTRMGSRPRSRRGGGQSCPWNRRLRWQTWAATVSLSVERALQTWLSQASRDPEPMVRASRRPCLARFRDLSSRRPHTLAAAAVEHMRQGQAAQASAGPPHIPQMMLSASAVSCCQRCAPWKRQLASRITR